MIVLQPETPRCFVCHGPYHPATGHLFVSVGVVYCGPCASRFFAWWRGHSRRKWSGVRFYEEAAKK